MNLKILLAHSSIIVSECGGKLLIRGTDLFPHGTQPLRQTNSLVRSVLYEHRLGPQPHPRLAVLPHDVQTRHDDASDPFAPVIPTLLDDGSDPLIEVVVEHWQCRLAYLQLCPIWHVEDIFHQLRDSLAAHPEELRLAVID